MKFLKDSRTPGLNYVTLYVSSTKLILKIDASFANKTVMKSQFGYLIMMMDKLNRCNIIHRGNYKCQMVARSVMATEVQAQMFGFDYAFLIQDMIEKMLGHGIII